MSKFPDINRRTDAFASLGKLLGKTFNDESQLSVPFKEAIVQAMAANPWFTRPNLTHALEAWSKALMEENILKWTRQYDRINQPALPADIAVIMAGNIPLVGFHDLICTLLTGNRFIGKLSREDNILLPAVAEVLCSIEPAFRDFIRFTTGMLDKSFDAVIATGSNNTSRYFEYYFSQYPHIIRKNRSGVAVLTGEEKRDELSGIGDDICLYFGLGCRNVSKVYLPEGYDPSKVFEAFSNHEPALFDHHRYMNNYKYQKTLYMLDQKPFLDNGTALLLEAMAYSSPVSVLHYEYYSSRSMLDDRIIRDHDLIQCIVSSDQSLHNAIKPGSSQNPQLWDYADGVDTVSFLLDVQKAA
jgi:hypothetical protein